MNADSPEWNNGVYIPGAQAYALYRDQQTFITHPNWYVNLCFEGLREWWLKHMESVSTAELPVLEATVQWYPLNWVPMQNNDNPSTASVWDWHVLDIPLGATPLTPYDVLSIPLTTFMDAVKYHKTLNISLWGTDGLMVVVETRIADRYHPGLQVLLD